MMACTLSLSSVQNLDKKICKKKNDERQRRRRWYERRSVKRRDRVTLTIFVIPYTCAFERNKTPETERERTETDSEREWEIVREKGKGSL